VIQTGSCRELYKSPSYQIKEGECVNVDVTGPGATMALGLMFFNTNNRYEVMWFTFALECTLINRWQNYGRNIV